MANTVHIISQILGNKHMLKMNIKQHHGLISYYYFVNYITITYSIVLSVHQLAVLWVKDKIFCLALTLVQEASLISSQDKMIECCW